MEENVLLLVLLNGDGHAWLHRRSRGAWRLFCAPEKLGRGGWDPAVRARAAARRICLAVGRGARGGRGCEEASMGTIRHALGRAVVHGSQGS